MMVKFLLVLNVVSLIGNVVFAFMGSPLSGVVAVANAAAIVWLAATPKLWDGGDQS